MKAASHITRHELRDIAEMIDVAENLGGIGMTVRATFVIDDSNGDRLGTIKRTSRSSWAGYAFFPHGVNR